MTSARGTDHRPAFAVLKASLRALVIRTAALYLRHAPVSRGRWRILSAVLPMLRAEGKTMGRRVVRCRHGFKMLADLEDWLGQYVYLTGVYEPPTAEVVQMLLGPGDTVLDIGANAGFFSLLAAARVSPSGRVFAFEPIPSVRRELEANVARNGFGNVRIRDEAVSDRRATLRIFEGPAAHKGLSSLRRIDGVAGSFEVSAIALDDLQEEIGPVRFAKIDVEGAELLVLEGAANLIARDRPHLVIEFTDEYLRAFGHSAEALSNWLFDRQYALYRIAETGLFRLARGRVPSDTQFNALCVYEDRLPPSVARKVCG
jgi:FkbM family methyltransferase